MNEEVNVQETVEPVIKKKLELDIDVTPHNQGENPFLKWIHLRFYLKIKHIIIKSSY